MSISQASVLLTPLAYTRYLEEQRWGQQPCCPDCGSQR
ncbi:transposase, partial [Candidatus Synechococcus spongiarum]